MVGFGPPELRPSRVLGVAVLVLVARLLWLPERVQHLVFAVAQKIRHVHLEAEPATVATGLQVFLLQAPPRRAKVPAMKINEMARAAYENSRNHGFWDGVERGRVAVIPEKLCLIHSEVSEALEVFREEPDDESVRAPRYLENGKPIGFDSELADIMLRVGDLAEHLGIDLERAIAEKRAFNAGRPRMHGKRA